MAGSNDDGAAVEGAERIMAGWNRNDEIIREREVYVDDQCCENCRYWCGWDPVESANGCKNYSHPDYEQRPEGRWCPYWKGER